jgi:hypothetical protein
MGGGLLQSSGILASPQKERELADCSLSRERWLDSIKLRDPQIPPRPPTLPPVDISPSNDGWHQITSGKGEKQFTWEVRISPYPDVHVPVEEGKEFVRITFRGIPLQIMVKILDIYHMKVDEKALSTLRETDPDISDNCLLVPISHKYLPDGEIGRGRFSAAAAIDGIFARLANL